VSETVGLNIDDVDFDNSRVKVTRKGGNESFVYFSDEATDYIQDYLKEREKIVPVDGHEDALFLSSQRKRISVRTVENMVKKYARVTTPLKKITPHKLRSTYGTALYQETGDIYLVADVLGHKDVNTTRKHYADIDQERKRGARNKVTLRENISKDTSIAEKFNSDDE
jgi:integrase/recombinase XerC